MTNAAVKLPLRRARTKLQKSVHFVDNAECSPKLVHTIPTTGGSVTGVRVMNGELFVVRASNQQHIEVYDVNSFTLKRHIQIHGMTNIRCLASCPVKNCLYVSCRDVQPGYNYYGQYPLRNTVHRVQLPGNGVSSWDVQYSIEGLSVNSAHNLIVVCATGNLLWEYTSTGSQVRQINLVAAGISNPVFAIQRSDDTFAVAFLNSVGIVKADGSLVSKYNASNVAGAGKGQLNQPHELFQCTNGCLLVADSTNKRIVVLNPQLDDAVILRLSDDVALNCIWSFFLDESCSRLYVGDYSDGRVLVVDDVFSPGRVLIYRHVLGEQRE